MTTLRNLVIVLSLFAALAFSGAARTDGIMSGPCIGCGEGIINVGAGKTCATTPTVSGLSVASGPTSGGTSVTITGTNFTGATAVNFGGTPAASFSVSNSTTIVATSPAASAGTIDVRVTQCASSPTSSADQFTFFAAPTVTAVSPNTGANTGGTSVTVSGTNFTGATVVNFGPGNPASFSITNSTTIAVASTPSGTAGTIDVTVTTPGGTSATSAADQFTYTGATYVGIIDVNGSAIVCFSLRACSAAYATGSNPAVDLVDQAGSNPITINILSNGNLDVASISAWVTAHSVTTIKVPKVYDQSGNSRHEIQATLANMPVLVLSALGSLPGLQFTKANTQVMQTTATFVQAQPFSHSIVAERATALGNNSSFQTIFGTAGTSPGVLFSNTANNITLDAGNLPNVSGVADNAAHSMQTLFNGVSSETYVDGTQTSSISPGSSGYNGTVTLSESSFPLGGYIFEVGLWAGDKSANNVTACHNQFTYFGTATSC